MEDIFSHYGDIFGGGFGGFGGFGGGGRRSSRRRQNVGDDLRITVHVTLKDVAHGLTKKIKILLWRRTQRNHSIRGKRFLPVLLWIMQIMHRR